MGKKGMSWEAGVLLVRREVWGGNEAVGERKKYAKEGGFGNS